MEMNTSRVLIIVPAFNEERFLKDVIGEIRNSSPDTDLLIIDDGSTDRTASIAAGEGVFVVRHPFNLGDGAARHTGYLFARVRGYEYVVQIDADGQHDPRFIEALLAPLKAGTADIAIGSRFLESREYRPTFLKSIGMFVFNAIASAVTGRRITDSTSGFRAVNRRVIKLYGGENFYPSHFPDADLIILSHLAGFRITEVPVRMRANRKERPLHRGLGIVYYVFKMLLSISVVLLRERPRRTSSHDPR